MYTCILCCILQTNNICYNMIHYCYRQTKIEHETGNMRTRELIQYLYATYPPDILFEPPGDCMLDPADLSLFLKEAIISYNPLWQKRDDNRWKQTCIHIRDVLIGRQWGLLLESSLENKDRMWRDYICCSAHQAISPQLNLNMSIPKRCVTCNQLVVA